jgi:hypothetical protein
MKLGFYTFEAAAIGIAIIVTLSPTKKESAQPEVRQKSRPRTEAREPAFWSSANISEPENVRAPLPEVSVKKPSSSPMDLPAQVQRHDQTGNISSLNAALTAWFETDSAAARDWLAKQDSLTHLQSALCNIAAKIAEDGNPAHAIEWASLLEDHAQREQSIFDIYALATRWNLLTDEQLKAAPLPPERIAELLSGAAGD